MPFELVSVQKGQGSPVVLLHPFPLSAAFWEEVAIPAGFRSIRPDFPGLGAGPVPLLETTLSSLAKSLFFHLEKEAVVEPIRLVGISMGGYWAFEFLRQFPGRVEALMLVSTRPGIDKPEARQKRLDMAERVLREGVEWLPEAMIPGLLGSITRSQKPGLVERLRKAILKAPAAGVAQAQRAMAERSDLTPILGAIRARTWILAGREDALIPVAEAEAMAKAIPNAKLEILEACGHLIPWETPDRFQELLGQWLTHPRS